MWRDTLASYKSSGKQVNYVTKTASAQGKNGYKLLKNDIKIGRDILTQPPRRNNEEDIPSNFQREFKREHMTCLV